MSTNWKAGDKALCVDGSPSTNPFFKSPMPIKGTIYLVTGIDDFPPDSFGEIGLFIAGLEPLQLDDGKIGFAASRFRKVVPACDRIAQEEIGLIPHEGFWEITNPPSK